MPAAAAAAPVVAVGFAGVPPEGLTPSGGGGGGVVAVVEVTSLATVRGVEGVGLISPLRASPRVAGLVERGVRCPETFSSAVLADGAVAAAAPVVVSALVFGVAVRRGVIGGEDSERSADIGMKQEVHTRKRGENIKKTETAQRGFRKKERRDKG